jgi:hypothetical protein
MAFNYLSFNDVIISTLPNKLNKKILTSTSLSKICQVTAMCYSVSLQIFKIEKYVSIIPANAGYLDL